MWLYFTCTDCVHKCSLRMHVCIYTVYVIFGVVSVDAKPENKTESPGAEKEGKGSLLALDDAILRCILSAESNGEKTDRIKRWLGSILLVGGGQSIPGLKDALSSRYDKINDEQWARARK